MFVGFGKQHAIRMRCITMPSVACLAVPYFSTLSLKRHDFRKKSYRTQNVFRVSLQILTENILLQKEMSQIK